MLSPKGGNRRMRSIELAETTIDVDGVPATGAELREKLGADADLVLRLSYLDGSARQRMRRRPRRRPKPTPDRTHRFTSRTGLSRRSRSAGAAAAASQFPPLPPRRSGDRDNDRVRFGGRVTVDEGETIYGDAVAIGGSTASNGTVTGNAVAIGGDLMLGPNADLRGDAVVVGGTLQREPGARIGGKVVEWAAGISISTDGRGGVVSGFGRCFKVRRIWRRGDCWR